jgi:hypothetical protein
MPVDGRSEYELENELDGSQNNVWVKGWLNRILWVASDVAIVRRSRCHWGVSTQRAHGERANQDEAGQGRRIETSGPVRGPGERVERTFVGVYHFQRASN